MNGAVDLLIRGGRLLDPAGGLDRVGDVAIKDGRIVAIAGALEPSRATRVVPAHGLVAVPGLVDMHVHVYEEGTRVGTPRRLAGVSAGVTVLCDGGSAGAGTIDGLARLAGEGPERLYCFLNLARDGLAALPEIRDAADIDEAGIERAVERHPGLIRGIKVRAVGPAVTTLGLGLVERAVRVARGLGLPVMVHVGEEAPPGGRTLTAGLLPLLGHGDVLTHAYTGLPGGLLDARGEILPEARAATDRGVRFDVGRGRINLGIDVARTLLEAGILPHVISSDTSCRFPGFPGPSLTDTMSIFLTLGMSLPDVVRAVTTTPSEVLGIADRRRLAVGADGDVTLLAERRGEWTYRDGVGGSLRGEVSLVPVLAIVGGQCHLAGSLPGSAAFA